MGVEPKIGGKNPKWMVKIMENPIKMDDLGYHYFCTCAMVKPVFVFFGGDGRPPT